MAKKKKIGYYEWLIGHISDIENHTIILRELFMRDFYAVLPRDDNRAEDGLELRLYFFEETKGNGVGMPSGACKVLEMLIALALRCERDIMHDEDFGDRTSKWFWMMIDNLGFTGFTDDQMYINSTISNLFEEKLEIFLDRKYTKKGVGGLFPLKKTKNDQRKVEIWYQMNEFLMENDL